MLHAGAVAQRMTAEAANGHDPQQPPAIPALSCSSGDSQAMTNRADAASSPPVSVRTSDEREDVPATHSLVATDGAAAGSGASGHMLETSANVAADRAAAAAAAKSPCRAMHTPAMTALLGEQPEKGASDVLDVLGIGQHKSAKGAGAWHDVHGVAPPAGAMEAQARNPVCLMMLCEARTATLSHAASRKEAHLGSTHAALDGIARSWRDLLMQICFAQNIV